MLIFERLNYSNFGKQPSKVLKFRISENVLHRRVNGFSASSASIYRFRSCVYSAAVFCLPRLNSQKMLVLIAGQAPRDNRNQISMPSSLKPINFFLLSPFPPSSLSLYSHSFPLLFRPSLSLTLVFFRRARYALLSVFPVPYLTFPSSTALSRSSRSDLIYTAGLIAIDFSFNELARSIPLPRPRFSCSCSFIYQRLSPRENLLSDSIHF